jgi:hypothetical protein
MPILKENRRLYPGGGIASREWKAIREAIRQRAGNRCEGSPKYPDCRAEGGQPHPRTGKLVRLTTAHLDHNPRNSVPDNLRCWCEICHNTYDGANRAKTRARRKAEVQP